MINITTDFYQNQCKPEDNGLASLKHWMQKNEIKPRIL